MYELTPTTTFLIGIFTTLSVYLLWFFHEHHQFWKRRKVPFLKPTIPFGNTYDLFRGKISFGEVFSNAYLEFKKRGLKHGGIYYFQKPVYIPVDPDIIKRIIISDADNFPNHGMYINPKDDPLSGHLFNMEDGKWRTLRSKTPSSFTSAKMRKMFTTMLKMVDPYTKLLNSHAENASPLDIKSVVSRFATDIFSACALGVDTNTLKFENEDLLRHGRAFFDYQWSRYKNTMVMTVPRAILEKLNFRIFKKETEEYVLNMFKTILQYRKNTGPSRGDLTDYLTKLTEWREEEKDFSGKNVMIPLEESEFAAQMFVFFCAGFETSSSTQTLALYELAKNPDCQKKLRRDIERVLARHDNKLTYDAIMEMKYLENVIDETLRMYPVFPILPRVCNKDYPVPGTDLILEKNTFVMVTNLGIQRDPEYYPNPEQFDPDRFNTENKGIIPHIANLPFGEGPRICVGKRFGLLQTKLGLVTLVKNYEVTLDNKTTKDFQFVSNELILRKMGDVWINLEKI